jgi:hypothetical protein
VCARCVLCACFVCVCALCMAPSCPSCCCVLCVCFVCALCFVCVLVAGSNLAVVSLSAEAGPAQRAHAGRSESSSDWRVALILMPSRLRVCSVALQLPGARATVYAATISPTTTRSRALSPSRTARASVRSSAASRRAGWALTTRLAPAGCGRAGPTASSPTHACSRWMCPPLPPTVRIRPSSSPRDTCLQAARAHPARLPTPPVTCTCALLLRDGVGERARDIALTSTLVSFLLCAVCCAVLRCV